MPLLDEFPEHHLVELPVPRYEATLSYLATNNVMAHVTLPHETERERAVEAALAALLLHPPETELVVRHIKSKAADARHKVEFHATIDEHRQIHRVKNDTAGTAGPRTKNA